MSDYRFPQQSKRKLRSSGLLHDE